MIVSVLTVQRALAFWGFDVVLDGVYGPQTAAAIREYATNPETMLRAEAVSVLPQPGDRELSVLPEELAIDFVQGEEQYLAATTSPESPPEREGTVIPPLGPRVEPRSSAPGFLWGLAVLALGGGVWLTFVFLATRKT